MRLDQRLRDSSDSCRSCSIIIIIMNSKRCSNLKYKSRSFSSGSTHFFYLIGTYIRECMHAMYVACMQCMYVCVYMCVCVYISDLYSLNLSSRMYISAV